MSDEPAPPPLRLKPRLRPESETGTGSTPSPAEATPRADSESSGDSAKLRLRPKLGASEEPAPAAAAPSAPVPATSESDPARPKPKLFVESEPPAPAPAGPAAVPGAGATSPAPTAAAPAADTAGEATKFKLKVRPPEATAAPAGNVPAPPPVIAPSAGGATAPANPPPFPVVADSAAAASAAKNLPPPVPHLRAPAGVKEEDLVTSKTPARRRVSIKTLALAAVLLIVAGGAFVAYQQLFAPGDPAEPTAPPPTAKAPVAPKPAAPAPAQSPAKPSPPGPTPSATINAIAAAPGQAIGKARAVVESRRQLEQERVDAMAEGQEPPPQRALNTPPPAALASRPAEKSAPSSVAITATSQIAPGITATRTISEMTGTATPAFQAWVSNVQVTGVRAGSPPRALLNGRVFRGGQMVDEPLGVFFESVDPGAKTITFRDRTGATISRKY